MEKKKLLNGFFAAAAITLLIFDSKAALSGAKDGIALCVRTVIPSLFPFFLLSVWLTDSLIGQKILPLEPLAKLMGMPKGTSSLLVSAFLGGYPSGAQAVAQSYREGSINKKTAERLLAFCSNAGPSFIFGMVGQMFSEPLFPWLLWGIHILSSICVSLILGGGGLEKAVIPKRTTDLSRAMERSIRIMATVCGWVIIFKIVIEFLDGWFLCGVSEQLKVIVTGLLELSNGCCSLNIINDQGLRFIICSGMLSAGGLCVTMQTASVVKGLSVKYYLAGKAVQCALSLFLAGMIVCGWWPALPAIFVPIIFFRVRGKKYSGNPSSIRV